MPTRFIQSYADPADMPQTGLPQVAFLGRSNAGKSTLINSMTGVKDLARASATPGRTRLLNVFEVDRRYHLVDLPGYGFAKMTKVERRDLEHLIDEFLASSPLLKGAVVIVDARLGPTELDLEMIESLRVAGVPFVLIANKLDKLSKSEAIKVLGSLRTTYADVPVIGHSSVSGIGRGEISDAVRRIAGV